MLNCILTGFNNCPSPNASGWPNFSLPLFVANFAMPGFDLSMLLIALSIIFLMAQLFMNQGFKFCKASEGAVILMSEVVFTGVAGVLLFHDSLGLSFFIGACLIVGSGVGLNLINRTPFPVRSSRNT